MPTNSAGEPPYNYHPNRLGFDAIQNPRSRQLIPVVGCPENESLHSYASSTGILANVSETPQTIFTRMEQADEGLQYLLKQAGELRGQLFSVLTPQLAQPTGNPETNAKYSSNSQASEKLDLLKVAINEISGVLRDISYRYEG